MDIVEDIMFSEVALFTGLFQRSKTRKISVRMNCAQDLQNSVSKETNLHTITNQKVIMALIWLLLFNHLFLKRKKIVLTDTNGKQYQLQEVKFHELGRVMAQLKNSFTFYLCNGLIVWLK